MTDQLSNASLSKLEPFLLMSKSAKGAAGTKLIQDATSAAGVFVFAELLDTPNIQELASNPQHAPWHSILELFSYGTYMDYKANKDTLPSLSQTQITKLKYLSLASLAQSSHILNYPHLQECLDIATVRELEDLIIDAMYQDVVRGRLDQLHCMFEVEWSMGRDLGLHQLAEIVTALNSWSQTTTAVLDTLTKKITYLEGTEKAHNKILEDHEKVFHENLKEVYAKTRDNQPPAGSRRNKGNREDGMDIDEGEMKSRDADTQGRPPRSK